MSDIFLSCFSVFSKFSKMKVHYIDNQKKQYIIFWMLFQPGPLPWCKFLWLLLLLQQEEKHRDWVALSGIRDSPSWAGFYLAQRTL